MVLHLPNDCVRCVSQRLPARPKPRRKRKKRNRDRSIVMKTHVKSQFPKSKISHSKMMIPGLSRNCPNYQRNGVCRLFLGSLTWTSWQSLVTWMVDGFFDPRREKASSNTWFLVNLEVKSMVYNHNPVSHLP